MLKSIDELRKLPDLDYLSDAAQLEQMKLDLTEDVMDYFLEGYDED